MLHPGTDAGFHVFDVDGRFVLARMLLQFLPCRDARRSASPHPPASSLALWRPGSRHRLRQIAPSMQQITQLIEVMLVGRGGDQAVGQPLLASTPMACQSATDCLSWSDASPDRVAALVLGRAGCLNDGGIHQVP